MEPTDAKNISKMATLIVLTIEMYIKSTRFLKCDHSNAKYNLKEKLHEKCTNINWSDDGKLKEAIAADNNKDDDEEDPQEKNRQLIKKK